jgi:hypothetical protein
VHPGQKHKDSQRSETLNDGFPPLMSTVPPPHQRHNPTSQQPQKQVTQSQLIERATKSISKIRLDTHDVLKHIQSMNSIELRLNMQYKDLKIEYKI